MLRRSGFGIWQRAYYHRRYEFVEGVLGSESQVAAQCQCYYQDMNSGLPKNKQLDSAIELPKQVPAYNRHLLVISPKDRSPEDLEWKNGWQSKLELNIKWPYSVISTLKTHLKHSRSGSGVLVNAVAMMSGDVKPLEVGNDRIAHIFVLPDNRLYTVHERQIEDFAYFVGGGKLKRSKHHKPSFDDYLKGANNAQLQTDDKSLRGSEPEKHQFDYKPSDKDWVLICGHYQRDERCGLVGQDLIKEIREKNLCPNQNVGLISHVGGHKYAGNVILYNNYGSNDEAGKHQLDCLWFGKVLPPNLSLLFKNLGHGLIPRDLYRGGISMN